MIDPKSMQIRHSNLKHIGQSPAHYLHRLRRSGDKSRSMDVGTAIHAVLLEGKKPIVFEGEDGKKAVRSGKRWEAFKADNEGQLILSASECRDVMGAVDAIRRNGFAMTLLEGEHEREIKPWTVAGRECGGRPDVTHPARITELKTGQTSCPIKFVRHGLRLGYAGQLGWYQEGLENEDGTVRECWIVAVEAFAPYVVTTFELTKRCLEQARKQNTLWVETLRVCEDGNFWPGYSQAPVLFDIPDDSEEPDYVWADEAASAPEAA